MDNSELLNYRIIGDGYPVLFLHGFLETLEMWEYFTFESEFQCILIDLPGHGKSAHFSDSAGLMKDMAKEVLKIVNHIELQSFSIVGHSMGGYVGLELMEMEARCEKLVLLNSNFWQDSLQKKEDRKRVAEIVNLNKNLFLYEAIPNLFYNPEECNVEIKKVISKAKKMDAATIGTVSIAMANRNSFEANLEAIATKLLIIHGEFDTIVPKKKMEGALKPFPSVKVDYVKSGHMSHIEQTKRTQQIIVDFLQVRQN